MTFDQYISAAKLDTLTFETSEVSTVIISIDIIDPVSYEPVRVYRVGIIPYGGKIVLYDMASVFCSALQKVGRATGSFSINVTGQDPVSLSVTHCNLNEYADLTEKFLTPMHSQLVNTDAEFLLAHTHRPAGVPLVLTALYVDDKKNITEIRKSSNAFSENFVSFSLDDIKEIMKSPLCPAALIAEEGDRRKVWYICKPEPDIILRFRNAYNAPEYLPLSAVISSTVKTESKSAISAGKHRTYDIKKHTEYEVKFTPINSSEIDALAQAVSSHSCTAEIPGVGSGEVAFTQADIKHSSSNEELDEITFSFRFCDRFGAEYSGYIPKAPEIFTENFTQSFS